MVYINWWWWLWTLTDNHIDGEEGGRLLGELLRTNSKISELILGSMFLLKRNKKL